MNCKEIYRIWAPFDSEWAKWVRPVQFIGVNEKITVYDHKKDLSKTINYIPNILKKIKNIKDYAIIIDLPGLESIEEGLNIARLGFRPIPLYNGTDEQLGAIPTVDNKEIKIGLIKGSEIIKNMKIEKDAPPAFLLDSNRMNRHKMNESIFDNSWDIYAQDMPSAEYLLNNGICKIIVICEKLQKDLKKILYKFQKKGIKIYLSSMYDESKEIKIRGQ